MLVLRYVFSPAKMITCRMLVFLELKKLLIEKIRVTNNTIVVHNNNVIYEMTPDVLQTWKEEMQYVYRGKTILPEDVEH